MITPVSCLFLILECKGNELHMQQQITISLTSYHVHNYKNTIIKKFLIFLIIVAMTTLGDCRLHNCFIYFWYRSICIIDNGASRRRTRNTRFQTRRADHSTTSMCSLQTAQLFQSSRFHQCSEVYMARYQNYEYTLSKIFITCDTYTSILALVNKPDLP